MAQASDKMTAARTGKTAAKAKSPAAAKRAPAKRATTKRATTKKSTASAPAKRRAPSAANADKRHAMISETAFYHAEQRGFQGDMAMDDWLRAEAEVDARIAWKRKVKKG